MRSGLQTESKTAISFIDLYQKVRKNFPEVRSVPKEERLFLGKEMIRIAGEHGMTVRPCGEADELAIYGADCGGCMMQNTYETALHTSLNFPKKPPLRKECACFLVTEPFMTTTLSHKYFDNHLVIFYIFL